MKLQNLEDFINESASANLETMNSKIKQVKELTGIELVVADGYEKGPGSHQGMKMFNVESDKTQYAQSEIVPELEKLIKTGVFTRVEAGGYKKISLFYK